MGVPLLIGLFLMLHGLIHLGYVLPETWIHPRTPGWPFDMCRSWLITRLGADATTIRELGTAFTLTVFAGFVVCGLAWLGLDLPPEVWIPLAGASSITSAATLAAFFHPWVLAGLAIDLGVLWLTAAGWAPRLVAG